MSSLTSDPAMDAEREGAVLPPGLAQHPLGRERAAR
jgi:hypothetical protein